MTAEHWETKCRRRATHAFDHALSWLESGMGSVPTPPSRWTVYVVDPTTAAREAKGDRMVPFAEASKTAVFLLQDCLAACGLDAAIQSGAPDRGLMQFLVYHPLSMRAVLQVHVVREWEGA